MSVAKYVSDDLYHLALTIVAWERKASTSYIQRRLKISYPMATKLLKQMEKENIVSEASITGFRQVLLPDHTEGLPRFGVH